MRIAVLNNYPLDRVSREVELSETPDHHLFGINHFKRRGYEVLLVGNTTKFRPSPPGGIKMPIPLGDLEQQRAVLRARKKIDLIYAPCATQTHLLQYLRALGLWRIPIVCLAHHPFGKGRLDFIRRPFFRLFVRGADALPCLSRRVASHLRGFGAGPKAFQVNWGPDLTFYPPSSSLGDGAIAAGRTGRDFITFGRAATHAETRATVVCLDDRHEYRQFGGNIRVLVQDDNPPVPGEKKGWMKYPELIRLYQEHRVIAIPLDDQQSLAGLTSLADALALGKPVVMTRNANIDIDIEAEGIGMWANPGDTAGWARALRWFDAHPEESAAMGLRARALADRDHNSYHFANRIMDVFDHVVGRVRRNPPNPVSV